MYFPWRGSHFVIIDAGSKAWVVISATESCSWYAFSAEITGAYDDITKWIRGYGTKLVWNSVTSTLRAPSNRSDAVSDEITCASRRFKFVYVGRSMSRLRGRCHRSPRCQASQRHPCARGASASTAPPM